MDAKYHVRVLLLAVLVNGCAPGGASYQVSGHGKERVQSVPVELLFDADQWNEVTLKLKQASNRSIESILNGNPNFEPLAAYRPETRLRALSRPVGRLDIRFQSGKVTTCTATLISVNRLLTNHHCVAGSGGHGLVVEASLLMGYYSDTDLREAKQYAVNVQPLNSTGPLDYAILAVDGNPEREWGSATLQANEPQPGDSLILIHHPGGRAKHVTRGNCLAGPTNESELFHKCDTLPGSSGAPIFSDDSDAVVALHYAGEPSPGPGAYNYGTLLSWISSGDEDLAALVAKRELDIGKKSKQIAGVSRSGALTNASDSPKEPKGPEKPDIAVEVQERAKRSKLEADMIRIPGGCRDLIRPTVDGGSVRKIEGVMNVCVDPFAMSISEVTVDEFRRFVEATGYRSAGEQRGCSWYDGRNMSSKKGKTWRDPGFEQSEDHPVVCVSWWDAMTYIQWKSEQSGLDYRLPTVAEWQYAAMGPSDAWPPWGEEKASACKYGNVPDQMIRTLGLETRGGFSCSDWHSYTAPIKQFSPNHYGLHDMIGNVWEWTQDCWSAIRQIHFVPGPEQPEDDCGGRAVAGAGWTSFGLSSVSSTFGIGNFAAHNIGFRIARNI